MRLSDWTCCYFIFRAAELQTLSIPLPLCMPPLQAQSRYLHTIVEPSSPSRRAYCPFPLPPWHQVGIIHIRSSFGSNICTLALMVAQDYHLMGLNALSTFRCGLCYPWWNQNASDKDEVWSCYVSMLALEECLACQVPQSIKH